MKNYSKFEKNQEEKKFTEFTINNYQLESMTIVNKRIPQQQQQNEKRKNNAL